MGGRMIVDNSGNLTIEGTLLAKGGIETNEIRSYSGDLTVEVEPHQEASGGSGHIGGFGKLLVKGDTEITNNLRVGNTLDVAGSASISGTLTASKIVLSDKDTSGVTRRDSPDGGGTGNILTAADNFLQNGINAPAIRTTGSAGTATLLAGSSEIVIFNPNITDHTLIYITPTSPTQNRTLFVADKKPDSYFKVAIDSPIPYDIKFNWWIIN